MDFGIQNSLVVFLAFRIIVGGAEIAGVVLVFYLLNRRKSNAVVDNNADDAESSASQSTGKYHTEKPVVVNRYTCAI